MSLCSLFNNVDLYLPTLSRCTHDSSIKNRMRLQVKFICILITSIWVKQLKNFYDEFLVHLIPLGDI